ncbi:MAG: ATP-binding protein [Actinomycetota bacterium]
MFQTLVGNLPDVVAVTDADGILRFVNPRVETLLGFKVGDVLGHKILDFVHPEDAPRAAARFAQVLKQEGECVPVVLRARDAQQTWISFEVIANNQLTNPEIAGVILTAHDIRYRADIEEAVRLANIDLTRPVEERITELARRHAELRIENQSRLQTEQELQKAISLLNAALDATADGLLVVSNEGKVSSCNSRFLELWGMGQTEGVGKDDSELLSLALPQLENSNDFLRRVQELYSHPEATSFDVIHLRDGRTFERYSQPQRIQDRVVGRVWSFRDVTLSRKLEEELRQSQKMEALGRLAGGMAHDFNNLLMIMSGYLDQVIRDPSLAAAHKSICEQVLATTRRGASLTRQLLAFSRKDQAAPQVAELNKVVLDMEGMLRRLISDVVRLEISLCPEPLQVFIDVHQVELIILNLSLNAQDAMPGGGVLSITTSSGTLAFDDKSDQLLKPCAVLRITDTGHGMTPEVQARIFEPFFTTKEQGRGTGLGLATVYGIVQRAGGQIKISSQPGQGASFVVYLPETDMAPGTRPSLPVETIAPRGHETILIAEDEAGIRAMTRTYLEGLGYRVLEAADGAEAIRLARTYRGQIDLVLSDVLMPGMRGDSAVDEIRRDRPAIRALFMSGFTDWTTVDQSLEIMDKPFEFPELGRRIRLLLDRGPAGDSSSAA